MDDVRKHIGFSMRVTMTRQPIFAHRHLPHANNWLIQASRDYSAAVDDLNLATRIIEASPEEIDPATMAAALSETARRLLEVAAQLAALSNRIDARSKEILEEAKAAAAEGREIIDVPVRPIPSRALLLRSDPNEIIRTLLQRRQRSKAVAPEDVPRRVSRGRAPPLLSDCTL